MRQRATDRIEVWFNWSLVGAYTSYEEARAKVIDLLTLAPVDLTELLHYLEPQRAT